MCTDVRLKCCDRSVKAVSATVHYKVSVCLCVIDRKTVSRGATAL